MRKVIDRSLALLLIVGAGSGYVAGSIMAYHDRPLAWLTVGATASWLATSAVFGILIGNPLDPRVIGFVLIAGGLLYFGLTTALAAADPSTGLVTDSRLSGRE